MVWGEVMTFWEGCRQERPIQEGGSGVAALCQDPHETELQWKNGRMVTQEMVQRRPCSTDVGSRRLR